MEIGATRFSPSVAANQLQATAAGRARKRNADFQQNEDDSRPGYLKERAEPVKVGFGNDSVKVPNLAVSTIKRNVRQAGDVIPTLEESQARVRERVAEDERRVAEQKPEPSKQFDLRASREAAISNARSFVSKIDATIAETRFRTGNGEAPATNRLDIRIGDTQIPYDKPDSRTPLDLRA